MKPVVEPLQNIRKPGCFYGKTDTFSTNLYTTENWTNRELVENFIQQNILKDIATVNCIEYQVNILSIKLQLFWGVYFL